MRRLAIILAAVAGVGDAWRLQKSKVVARRLLGFNPAATSFTSASESTRPRVGSSSVPRLSTVGMASIHQDIFPFPEKVIDVISAHLSLADCSYVDLPMDLGQRILDSDFLQQHLKHPLSKFEIGKGLSMRRMSPAVLDEISLLSALTNIYKPGEVLPDHEDDLEDEQQQLKTDQDVELRPGLGLYELDWENEPLFIVFFKKEQGAGRGAAAFVRGQGRQSRLQTFCNLPVFKANVVQRKVPVFVARVKANTGELFWEQSEPTSGRGLETVLLPSRTKNMLEEDMEGFLSAGRLAFFRMHGIPYKRSYLFYGVPGAGKSSMIRALATKFERRLCILQPSGPAWNDFLLHKAVQTAPKRAMIILEDADSLFAESRENTAQSGVTFSGLLNVLDGVNCKDGSVFVLTTNFRDRLDEALTREGRIDIEVPFHYIKPAEVVSMFRQFYPSEADAHKAEDFPYALRSILGDEGIKKMSPAALQLYFVKQFGKSADEAIQNVVECSHQFLKKTSPRQTFSPDEWKLGGKTWQAP